MLTVICHIDTLGNRERERERREERERKTAKRRERENWVRY